MYPCFGPLCSPFATGAMARRSQQKNRPVLFDPAPRFFFPRLVLFPGSFSLSAVLFGALGLCARLGALPPVLFLPSELKVVGRNRGHWPGVLCTGLGSCSCNYHISSRTGDPRPMGPVSVSQSGAIITAADAGEGPAARGAADGRFFFVVLFFATRFFFHHGACRGGWGGGLAT